MHLSWNEIRARAARFAEDWKDARYERGESQTFYNEFFEVFGITRRRVASFEEPVRLLGERRGFLDLWWKGVLLVEQKSAGRDLARAKQQALDYFPGLRESELPRYILVCDFQNFELHDLDETRYVRFRLHELPAHIEDFAFILGVQKRTFRDQDPVNIEASELMGQLHDALKASGYTGHDLERILVRLVFCLFADDTGIFDQRDVFSDLIANRTNPDGSDTGLWVSQLFEVLNTPLDSRQRTLDEDLAQFPYVNGDLFAERLPIPSFNSDMRRLLLTACNFNWDAISPAIFGSLFQSVMLPLERRQQGAHYTTEKNILKVIEPLFFDELRAEFEQLKKRRDTGRGKALANFHSKLAGLTFFDPACGCGNFLIISYRELRQLELEVLKELHRKQRNVDVQGMSQVDVDQFYGIELGEFPARIAEVALWMMDHIMNNRLSLEFGESYVRIPLRKSPHIRHSDALEIEWSEVIAAERCSYIFGNPPFVGAKMQSPEQREQVRNIAKLGGSGGSLDYVAAWFIKAGQYVSQSSTRIGFVATNSITQGEQVAQLWPILFDRCGLEIMFAHRTFAWGSDARGVAQVHVVVIGMSSRRVEPPIKRLFSYDNLRGEPTESVHAALTAYLFDGGKLSNRHLVIHEVSNPINGAPKMIIGSKPIDGGYLIFDDEERAALLTQEPDVDRFLKPFVGGAEYLQGRGRWILSLQNADPADLRPLRIVKERLQAVREYRLGMRQAKKWKEGSPKKEPGTSARALAEMPAEFHVTVIPTKPFLAIPENSSQTRDYLPIGWLVPPVIPSNKLRFIRNADLWHFGILTSRMHMAWMRCVSGRIKSDFQYSIGIVYNTFPWPEAEQGAIENIRVLANGVLEARSLYPTSTLADLYAPNLMPRELHKAHRDLDSAVDKLFRKAAFSGDLERVEHLFGSYEKLVTPLMPAEPQRKRVRVRRVTPK